MKNKFYYKDKTIFEGDDHNAPHHKDSSKILHREDGPAIEYSNGDKFWHQNNKLHRENGPAIEWANGSKTWYLNDKLHREDGPAIEYSNGDKFWHQNNNLHREDGPAIECVNGYRAWYLNDNELETLPKKYLIRYMKLTGETLVTLLVHPDRMIRDSVKKYKWN